MPIPVTCACGATLRVPDAVAGRKVKCPKCTGIVAVPAAAAATAAPRPATASAAASKKAPSKAAPAPKAPPAPKPPAHVKEFAELPDHLRDRARAELQKGETVVWAGRPHEPLLVIKWWAAVGLGCLASLIGLAFAVVAFGIIQIPEWWVKLLLGGLLSIFIVGGPFFGWLNAIWERRRYANRAYVLTNKRCLVVERAPDTAGAVEAFAMPQLQFLFTQLSWFVKGAGDVVLRAETNIVREHTSKGTRSHRQTTHFGFLAIADAKDVEERVRSTLVEPWLAAEERGEDPASATGQVAEEPAKKPSVPAAAAAEAESADEAAAVDANEKEMPLANRAALMSWETPPHLQDKLGKELGRGEKLIWTGKPSLLLVILNGLIGPVGALLLAFVLVIGIADLICYLVGLPAMLKFGVLPFLFLYLLFGFTIQPLWAWWTASRTDYVLTNRRAILWRPSFLGVLSKEEYRPDELEFMRRRNAWFLGDGAGSVIFRTVITTTTTTDNRGFKSSRSSTQHYGFLNVRCADTVERLINVTLLAQLRPDGSASKISGGMVEEYGKLKTAQTCAADTGRKERNWMLLACAGGFVAMLIACAGAGVNASLTGAFRDSKANKQAGDGKPKDTTPALSPLEQALADLKSPDAGARQKGADSLKGQKVVDSRKEEVSRALETALREAKDSSAAGHVLEAMKTWATPDVADTLLDRLQGDDNGNRGRVIELLGELKVAKAAEPLAARLTQRNERGQIEKALKSIGEPAVPVLLKYVNHPEAGVRGTARSILKASGVAEAPLLPQHVADLKSDNAATRSAAVVALAQVKTAEAKFQPDVARAMVSVLADAGTREAAAHGLVVWATKESVPALIGLLDEKNDKVRNHAFDALLRLADDRSADKIAEHLGGPFGKDRAKATAVLVALGPAAEDAVLKQLDSKDKGTRIAACEVLKDVGTAKSVDALKKLASDRDGQIKAAATKALAEVEKRK